MSDSVNVLQGSKRTRSGFNFRKSLEGVTPISPSYSSENMSVCSHEEILLSPVLTTTEPDSEPFERDAEYVSIKTSQLEELKKEFLSCATELTLALKREADLLKRISILEAENKQLKQNLSSCKDDLEACKASSHSRINLLEGELRKSIDREKKSESLKDSAISDYKSLKVIYDTEIRTVSEHVNKLKDDMCSLLSGKQMDSEKAGV